MQPSFTGRPPGVCVAPNTIPISTISYSGLPQIGTLDRQAMSNTTQTEFPTSYKFKSLAVVSGMMIGVTHRKEKELEYLGAVERGDVDEVRRILTKHSSNVPEIKVDGPFDVDDTNIVFADEENGTMDAKTRSASESGSTTANETQDKQRRCGSAPRLKNVISTISQGSKHAKLPEKPSFNKNCRDSWGRSALFIAISKKNLEMIEELINHEVDMGECLYHAIEFGYYDGVKLLIEKTNKRDQVITDEDSFYSPGLTPVQLAAHKNDYIMLKILHTNGFRIMSTMKTQGHTKKMSDEGGSVLHHAWHQTNNRLLYYRAMSSPAYLIMMFTESGFDSNTSTMSPTHNDFLEQLFSLYDKLRKKTRKDPDARGVYLELAEQVETFGCRLLDEVRSADDLSSILRFNPPGIKECAISTHNKLRPIQRACDVSMKRFVAHQHCQLALSSIRLGDVFDDGSSMKTIAARFILALLFPILSLFFICAPNTRVGKLMMNPMINLSCHMMSEVIFVVIIFIRLILLTHRICDCLGVPPNKIEIIILLWVLGKAINEVKMLQKNSFKSVITNIWKLNDLTTLGLFLIVIILRSYEIAQQESGLNGWDCPANVTTSYRCNRSQWRMVDAWPILLSEAGMSFVHLLIFIRAMELMYIHRTFGPLQLSLDKMLLDTIKFLLVFVISFFAFACVMTQLYWAYGMPRSYLKGNGSAIDSWTVCGEDDDQASDNCEPVYSKFQNALLEQFWTLFGYGYKKEPPQAVEIPDEQHLTLVFGMIASGFFHLWAVVVMLNMLIAMLSFSFERIRGNAELEWKFHRTKTWMKYITTEVHPRPPPMNIIPSIKFISKIGRFVKTTCHQSPRTQRRQYALRVETGGTNVENIRYQKVLKRVTSRYLKKHLLEEFQHDEDTNFLLQQRITNSRSSTPAKEVLDHRM